MRVWCPAVQPTGVTHVRLTSIEDALRHLRREVYVRLSVSPIHGVGVIAVRDIPVGVDPFQERELGLELMQVPLAAVMEDREIPDAVKQAVRDLCSDRDGFVNFPRCGMNGIMPLYYMNESADPNIGVGPPPSFYFRTLRLIRAGEELTTTYSAYSDTGIFEPEHALVPAK